MKHLVILATTEKNLSILMISLQRPSQIWDKYCLVQNGEGNKNDVLYDLNLLIVKINYWIKPIVFLPTGILWLSVSSSKFANYIAIVKEIGYFMNDPILIFCPLSRFKLCFVETQVFWRSRVIRYHLCSRHVFLVNESNFPDLLITRILKIRFVYLIAFFYFYNIVMSEKFWSQSFVNYTASEKDQKIGSFMNVPICKLYFSLKKPKPCFSKIQLLWRSYVMTNHVFQRDVFHAANELFLEMLGVIFLVNFYIIPVDTKKMFWRKMKKIRYTSS